MHSGKSFLSFGESGRSPSSGNPWSGGNAGAPLSKIWCLMLVAVALFLLSPNPNGRGGGGAIDDGAAPPSEDRRGRAYDPRERTRHLPARVQVLMAQNQIVGDRLGEIKEGTKSVEEIVHAGVNLSGKSGEYGGIGSSGHIGAGAMSRNHKSAPMTLAEVLAFFQYFLKRLDSSNVKNKRATYHGIWSAYHDLALKTLYPWDREYLSRMPPRREDGSVFLSVSSFRDERCPDTLKGAFENAKDPDRLFVGLVQQNCEEKCRTGVMDNGKTEDAGPDVDCYAIFCSSETGRKYCDDGHVRLLRLKESQSLGPYMARYFASKLWLGEEWYMQIDSHMTFARDWDARTLQMLKAAPSERPVISHYPPPHTVDLAEKSTAAAPRLCGPKFATGADEGQIVKLEGSFYYDSVKIDTPRFAPFVAMGYLAAHSNMLQDVPFDPFLPYIFMGDDVLLSARLWTSGYDIFSPTHSLLGHQYIRNNKPKFWEAVNRAFTSGVWEPLHMLIRERVKMQLGYPESATDMVKPKTLFSAVGQYSMGTERSLEEYLKIVGLEMTTKEVSYTAWCETGVPPPGFEKYNHMYQ